MEHQNALVKELNDKVDEERKLFRIWREELEAERETERTDMKRRIAELEKTIAELQQTTLPSTAAEHTEEVPKERVNTAKEGQEGAAERSESSQAAKEHLMQMQDKITSTAGLQIPLPSQRWRPPHQPGFEGSYINKQGKEIPYPDAQSSLLVRWGLKTETPEEQARWTKLPPRVIAEASARDPLAAPRSGRKHDRADDESVALRPKRSKATSTAAPKASQ